MSHTVRRSCAGHEYGLALAHEYRLACQIRRVLSRFAFCAILAVAGLAMV